MDHSIDRRDVTILEPGRRGVRDVFEYSGELLRRRHFVLQLAISRLKAEHLETALGRAWLVVNPLLLAGVYFVLVRILAGSQNASREFFSLLVVGLFLFFFTRNSLTYGASSIVRGGNLLLNSSFPRAVLPVSAVLSAFISLLASLPIFLVIHLGLGQRITLEFLALPVVVLVLLIFNLGIALIAAMLTVYLRDMRQIIPYISRIWIYMTPILYRYDDVPAGLATFLKLNPLYPFFAFVQQVVGGGAVDWTYLVWASAIALGCLLIGAAAFLSRESEYGIYV